MLKFTGMVDTVLMGALPVSRYPTVYDIISNDNWTPPNALLASPIVYIVSGKSNYPPDSLHSEVGLALLSDWTERDSTIMIAPNPATVKFNFTVDKIPKMVRGGPRQAISTLVAIIARRPLFPAGVVH